MMTPSNLHHPNHPTTLDNNQTTTIPKKQTTTTTTTTTRPQQQEQQPLKCPRCDSPNTKFCYYNNYSLTQPRHFCKTCRRYWTKGGALRNVPIGGGIRKSNKKLKSSASASSSSSKDYSSGSSSVDFGGGFKLFHGLSPAMDFNLGGFSLPRFNPTPTSTGGIYNHFSTTFGDHISGPNNNTSSVGHVSGGFSLDLLSSGSSSGTGTGGPLLGFNAHQLSSSSSRFGVAIQDMGGGVGGGSMNVHNNLASSIESLSSINQDLHWKLQQQRLATLFGGREDQKDITSGGIINGMPSPTPPPPQVHKNIQPILFQNLEISSKPELCVGNSRKEGANGTGEAATEWFFGNSYGQAAAAAATPTNSNSNGNDSAGNWNNNGVHASWRDLHHYNSLSLGK